MAKQLSMDAVNQVNETIKKLQELMLALGLYENSLFILEIQGMINQLKKKLKP